MDYQVILSDPFIADIKGIVDYLTQEADPETAARVIDHLMERAVETGRVPFAGKPVKRRPGARKVKVYSYLIYYDVNETEHTVEVLHAWHGARNPRSLKLG